MNEYTYDRILQDLRTVDDLEFLRAEIDMLLVSLYKTDPTEYQNILKTKLQHKLAESLTISMTEQHVPLDNREQLEKYLHGLKDFLTHVPILQLTLAYHPGNEQIDQLCEWARQHTNKPVVLQMYHNASLLGGAVITYEGQYADLSLKKKLSTVYQNKKQEILALLNSKSEYQNPKSETNSNGIHTNASNRTIPN